MNKFSKDLKLDFFNPKFQKYQDLFENEVLARLDLLPKGLIHNDLNPGNVLI